MSTTLDALLLPLNQGLDALHAGAPFEAHESFEAAMLAARAHADDAPPRGEPSPRAIEALARVLALRAAAAVKADQGNPVGRARHLEKLAVACATLGADTAGGLLGLDLVALEAEARWASAAPARALPRVPTRLAARGVLYLHGFASSPRSSKAQRFVARAEARGVPIKVPDLNRDDPTPDRPDGRFAFEALTARRALRAARRLAFPRTIVVGSSLGGYLATLLAADDPTRVERLILMAPAFDLAARLEGRHGAAALVAWRASGATEVDHYGTERPERIGYGLLADARRHAPMPDPGAIPSDVLHGLHDDVVPIALSERFVAARPDTRRLVHADDGHELVASVDVALAFLDAALDAPSPGPW
jgi:pimeloyl-ACP methyl ester carboxylesterase